MIKLDFALLSYGVSIDRETNNLSIFNQIDQVQTEKLPALIPELVFIAVLKNENQEDEQIDVSITCSFPSTESKELARARMNFSKNERNRLVAKFVGFKLEKYGIYKFTLKWQDQEHKVDLDLRELPGNS